MRSVRAATMALSSSARDFFLCLHRHRWPSASFVLHCCSCTVWALSQQSPDASTMALTRD